MTDTHDTFIGLDLGTSALKGVLTDASGHVLHTAKRLVVYHYPAPGHVEADPLAHWHDVASLIRELAAAAPAPVRALALSGASGNTLLTDAAGTPLTPILNWMDRRCEGVALDALEDLTSAAVRRVTGWPCVDSFPLAHLAWLRAYCPDVFESAAHACMNTDWLLFKLAGQWAMDHSTATTFHLQDQVERCWHAPYLTRLGLHEKQLSRLTASGTSVGPLTAEAARATGLTTATLAVSGAFDHPSAARAVGVVTPGQLMLSCGTSWVGFLPCVERDALLDAEMLCDPFLSAAGGPWGGMFSVPAIGPTIDWYVVHQIAPGEAEPLRVFDARAAEAAPGADGLEIDLLAPPQRIDGTPAQIARAVMEGAARALNERLARLRAHGFAFRRAVMVGGPGNSPVWPGILAAATGLDLTVGSAHAGAVGAALLAAAGAGSTKEAESRGIGSETGSQAG